MAPGPRRPARRTGPGRDLRFCRPGLRAGAPEAPQATDYRQSVPQTPGSRAAEVLGGGPGTTGAGTPRWVPANRYAWAVACWAASVPALCPMAVIVLMTPM